LSDDSLLPFSQLGLAAPVLQAVAEIGYELPSPIQAASIPPLLQGRDLLGQAQTGTGKTAAFALPLLSRIDLGRQVPQLLVLTPTRELALQVAEAMQSYARHLPGFHILPVYGGQGMGVQLTRLKRGVHVVVGTPGRVMDHLRRGTLQLDKLAALVLDEADEMLRMGFAEDVEFILEHTPSERQVALFSATMPAPIRRVAKQHLREPVEVRIESRTTTVESITQRYWLVSGIHKLDALTRILESEEMGGILIFVRTKTATTELAEKLEARGYASAALNGDMSQVQREQTVDRLKRGALDIVVATDVAARGLDVERISHVINYDIPHDTESYVHRIGRTGRAGRKGEAILFVSPREKRMLFAIEKATGQTIEPMRLPTHEAVTDKRVARFKQRISETLEAQELGFFETLVEEYQSEHDVGLAEIAAALAYLVQKERPLKPERAAPDERPERAERPERPQRQRGEGPFRERQPERAGGRDEAAPRPARPRPERPAREEGPERGPKHRAQGSGEVAMVPYRLEVGKNQGALPKHIVGAIANEAGLDSQYIGRLKLYDDHSTIELPDGMPKEVFQHLRKVRVCGLPLRLSRVEEEGAPTGRERDGAPKKRGGRSPT
jgi:ATP-dependent RNA helicase DeaD